MAHVVSKQASCRLFGDGKLPKFLLLADQRCVCFVLNGSPMTIVRAKRAQALLAGAGSIFAIVFAVIIAVVFGAFERQSEGNRSEVTLYTDGLKELDPVGSPTRMLFIASINSIDLAASLMRIQVQVWPFGAYSSPNKLKVPTRNFTVAVGDRIKEYHAGRMIEDLDVVNTLMGDLSRYPFDNFTAKFLIGAQEDRNNGTGEIADSAFALVASIQGFRFADSTVSEVSRGVLLVQISIRRSGITTGFSIFITALMWLLSLVIFAVAIDIAFFRSAVPPPILAVPLSSLFALPAMRNIQPGSPPVGVLSDMVGFLWNMALIALSAIIILVSFMLKRRESSEIQ